MTNIQAGDVVVCVDAELAPWRPHVTLEVKCDGLYRVLEVFENFRGGVPVIGLRLAGVDAAPFLGLWATRFRKVLPADTAFTAQMRALKPRRVTA